MKLTIRTRNVELPQESLTELQDRIGAVFARLTSWIHAVDVTIADVNGPKGGADKQCRLRVRSRSMKNVVVEQMGVDAIATVRGAAERAAHTIVRAAARRRTFAATPRF